MGGGGGQAMRGRVVQERGFKSPGWRRLDGGVWNTGS